MTTKHITINIGPQDSASWFFVAVAAVLITMFLTVGDAPSANDIELARIQAQAHAKP